MKAYWYGNELSADLISRNWGDIIAPVILQALTGQVPVLVPRAGGRVVSVGSIMHKVRENDHIWGTGVISPTGYPTLFPKVLVHAVRGPKTREVLKALGVEVPELYGDPALLTPYLFDLSCIQKTHDLGIIPHYNDWNALQRFASKDVKVIDICAGIEPVLREVASCRNILASSLHGLVLGDCFAERAAWLQVDTGKRLVGASFKFEDYLLGTGREPDPTSMTSDGCLPPIRWLPKAQVDLEILARSCPFRSRTPLGLLPRKVL